MDDPWLASLKQVDSFRNNRTIEHALIVSKLLVYLHKENNMPYSDGSGDLTAAMLALRTSLTTEPSGGAAGANKLWLPLWSGEVINAYDEYNVFENLITNKTLSGGFSYEFPVTGTVALNASWDAGEELVGGDSSSTTFKVNLDKRPMAAHFETDNVDLLVTQWDYRSELARQSGLTLANTRDKQIVSTLIAASVVAPLTSDPRGLGTSNFPAPAVVDESQSAIGVAVSGCTETVALKILQKIEDYLVFMQENNYPVQNVYCAVTPKVFQVIRALGIPRSAFSAITSAGVVGTSSVVAATNNFSNYPLFGGSSENGGLGAPLSMGMNALADSLDYMGVKIIKTNHIPRVDLTAAAIGGAKYNLVCNTVNIFGLIFQPEAIAGLSLMGMKVDTVQDVRRNTQFTVASMLKGTGILRPELCQILVGTTSAAAGDTAAEIDARSELATIFGTASGFGAEYAVTS